MQRCLWCLTCVCSWYIIFCHCVSEHLNDDVLRKIFSNIPLQDLIQSVCKVCTRFNSIVKNDVHLWKNFDFDYPLHFSEESINAVLPEKRIKILRYLSLPFATEEIITCDIDRFLCRLTQAHLLTWLDISGAQTSSLHFVKELTNLSVLIVDTCKYLQDCDISVVKELRKLEHLYIGYTSITAEGIIRALPPFQKVNTLECSGIYFVEEELIELLERAGGSLKFLAVSVRSHVDVIQLSEQYSVKLTVLI